MKQKAGFIMCDYAFNHDRKSKRGMATKLRDLAARTISGLDPVGRVRIVERKV